jgi:hypothetical protein
MKECYTNKHRRVQRFATLQLGLLITAHSTTQGPCLATFHKLMVIIVRTSYHYCMFQKHPLSSFLSQTIILGMLWTGAKNSERMVSEDDTLKDDTSNWIIHSVHWWFFETWGNEHGVQQNNIHIKSTHRCVILFVNNQHRALTLHLHDHHSLLHMAEFMVSFHFWGHIWYFL